jgi:hypothetical protein
LYLAKDGCPGSARAVAVAKLVADVEVETADVGDGEA